MIAERLNAQLLAGVPESEPRPFSFESWSVLRIAGEKVVEQWGIDDSRLARIVQRLQLLRGLVAFLPHSADAPKE